MKKLFKTLGVAAVAAPSTLIYSAYVQNEDRLALTESLLMNDVEAITTPGDPSQTKKVEKKKSLPFCPNGTITRTESKSVSGEAESAAAFRTLFNIPASASVRAAGKGKYSSTYTQKINVPVQYVECVEGTGDCKAKTCAEVAMQYSSC